MSNISYTTKIYNPSKAFIFALLPAIALISLIVVLGRYFDSTVFMVIGWVSVCIIPFAFQKKYKHLFTKIATLEFDESKLLIIQRKTDDDSSVSEISIFWEEIKNYKCYFSASNVTFLSIYFKNGSSKTFPFDDQKEMQEAFDENSVFSIFFYFVSKFNLTKNAEEKIEYKPAIFASSGGKAILYIMLGLYLTVIVFHMTFYFSTSIYSIFMGFFILLSLFIKSKNDKDFTKKLDSLSPRTPSI